MFVVCHPSFYFLLPSFQKHPLNNVHNLCLARALLPGLDNSDSSLENQCSDRTESGPEGERGGRACWLSELLKEKSNKEDSQERGEKLRCWLRKRRKDVRREENTRLDKGVGVRDKIEPITNS